MFDQTGISWDQLAVLSTGAFIEKVINLIKRAYSVDLTEVMHRCWFLVI